MHKSIRRALAISAAAVALSLSTPAQAWGPEGHSLIIRVAYAGLSPALRQRFDYILAHGNIDHAYDHLDNHTHQMRHEDCRAHNLDQLANWADCVRYDSDPHYGGTYDDHFDDIPLCGSPPKPVYCKNGVCGTEALKHYYAILHDPHSLDNDRLEALAFVVHFVGDLHQPLHTINNGLPHQGDNGGNGIRISAPGGAPNLHSFWDGGLVHLAYPNPAQALSSLTAAAQANATVWGAQMDPEAWVRDAHAIAKNAYAGLQHPPPCNAKSWEGGSISASYVQTFVPIVRQQLGMAAVRLRNVLASALS